jgi:hypothetical protein
MQVYESEYVPLCDDEWAVVDKLISPYISQDRSGSGRKRKPVRPTLNAVLHVLTTGISFTALTQVAADYPSMPTVKRFYQELLDANLLTRLGDTLEFTRPQLKTQVKTYLRASKLQAKQYESPEQKAAGASWGFNLSPLPWGKPMTND